MHTSPVLLLTLTLLLHLFAANSEGICGRSSFSDDSGFVVSPGFPHSYANNLNCTYTIEVGQRRTILLEFQHFDLETYSFSDSCAYDWLMIRCLSNESSTSNLYTEQRLCRAIVAQMTLRDCHTVKLHFHTDEASVKQGFKIFYTTSEDLPSPTIQVYRLPTVATSRTGSECGSTSFAGSFGIITSPRHPDHYLNSLNCTYSIALVEDRSVVLTFKSFDVEGFSRHINDTALINDSFLIFKYCPHDWLTIQCLPQESSVQSPYTNRRLCGHQMWQFTLNGCTIVTLNFFTDASVVGKGFKLFYETSANVAIRGDEVKDFRSSPLFVFSVTLAVVLVIASVLFLVLLHLRKRSVTAKSTSAGRLLEN